MFWSMNHASRENSAATVACDDESRGSRRRTTFALSAGFYILTRVMVIAVAWLAPQDREQTGPDWWSEIPLLRWDSGHYLGILTAGYPPEINDTVAFFPGYPLAALPLVPLIGAEWALVVIANVCGLAAALLLCAWTQRYCGQRAAFIAVALWACYPPALFLSVGYADSMFALCAGAVLLLLARERPIPAAIIAGLATAVRPPGVALAVVIFVHQVFAIRGSSARSRWLHACALGLVSCWGLVAHESFLWNKYGRWDAYFAAQRSWTPQGYVRHAAWKAALLRPVIVPALRPVENVLRGHWPRMSAHRTWDLFFNLVLLTTGIVGLIRPGPMPRAAYLLPILAFVIAWLPDPVTGARLYGISRYQLVALPCFARLGAAFSGRSRVLIGGLLLAMFALQCLFMAGFVDWLPVG